jgi:hypothetical protein
MSQLFWPLVSSVGWFEHARKVTREGDSEWMGQLPDIISVPPGIVPPAVAKVLRFGGDVFPEGVGGLILKMR